MVSTAGRGKHCQAINKQGKPCRGFAVNGGVHCFMHDPDHRQARRAACSKGGHARHGRKIGNPGEEMPEVIIETASDVLPVMTRTVNDLFRLENSVARARAIAYVCGQITRAFETSDLQARVEALETALNNMLSRGAT